MSSWKLGTKGANPSRSATPVPPSSSSRSSTPMPSETSQFRNGLLTISIYSGSGLTLPPNTPLPACIQNAVTNPQQSGHRSNRESMQRKRNWWLPYVVLEFDKNEILIDAVGGELSNPIWNYRADFDVSRKSNIAVTAYLRTAPVQGKDDMGNDILLSRVDLMPILDSPHASEEWYPATSPPTATSSSFHLKITFRSSSTAPLTIEAFDLLKVIGKGSFGKLTIAQRPGEITHILAERTVLALVNNPFIVPLKFSFQNPDKLYLVMSFVNGGELFYHLQREGKFDELRSRFYAAELLCALEHLHGFNVVYRDLKPENILLDYTGHIALCDFGLCKLNMSETEKTNTFCGTPEYIAPELLESQGYTKTVDWWTLGVLLYEMMTGLPPFYDENVNTMYQRILTDPLTFPPDMPSDAKSVMTGLLIRDPSRRLGANGAEDIKRHPFFSKHIDWQRLLAKKIPPPAFWMWPTFDTDFTNEEAQDSVVLESALSKTVQDQFQGFTYNPANEHLSESVSYSNLS
ncbi:kinase-like domain-containing protein [Flagelloscypha sp. PMI_526]|nr:kinase-like domain-containing protein [Flagelloscypha sp. PMI_526]